MTNKEMAIITAYTSISFGRKHFPHFHEYAEEKFGHPVWTHEMANKEWWDELKKLCEDEFIYLAENPDDN